MTHRIRGIVVLCTGNICRSPIGEALLRERLKGRNCTVISAGTHAMTGHPADPLSQQVLLADGLDISAHRAQQATQELLTTADLILALDRTHMRWIDSCHSQLRGRAHLLLKWRKDAEVADPYGLPIEAFENALSDIRIGVDDWLQRL